MEALRRALAPFVPPGSGQIEELSPETLRQLLLAVGEVDPGIRDAMLAAAQKIDPNFQ